MPTHHGMVLTKGDANSLLILQHWVKLVWTRVCTLVCRSIGWVIGKCGVVLVCKLMQMNHAIGLSSVQTRHWNPSTYYQFNVLYMFIGLCTNLGNISVCIILCTDCGQIIALLKAMWVRIVWARPSNGYPTFKPIHLYWESLKYSCGWLIDNPT